MLNQIIIYVWQCKNLFFPYFVSLAKASPSVDENTYFEHRIANLLQWKGILTHRLRLQNRGVIRAKLRLDGVVGGRAGGPSN
jgi:hypothetical protein